MAKDKPADATTAPATDEDAEEAEDAAEDAQTVKSDTRDDGTPKAASSTVAQGDSTNAPPNVEVAPQSHERQSTSQSADVPIGVTPSVPGPNVVPNLLPQGAGPTGQAVGQVDNDTASDKQLAAFLKITGWKKQDVIGSNKERRTFVTAQGGKYELSPKGTKVRVLSGPIPPGPAEKEGDED